MFSFAVDKVFIAQMHINDFNLWFILVQEISRRPVRPILLVIQGSLGFATEPCENDATTCCGYLSLERETFVYV